MASRKLGLPINRFLPPTREVRGAYRVDSPHAIHEAFPSGIYPQAVRSHPREL